MNNEIIKSIKNLIDTADKCKNAYFWKSDSSAGGRRSTEKKYSVPEIKWTEGGHEYTAEYVVNCSCAHVYAYGKYTKDGEKTTLLAIKNSFKRMSSEMA